jgi:hypothetical protein
MCYVMSIKMQERAAAFNLATHMHVSVARLVEIFPAFFETPRFNTVFIKAQKSVETSPCNLTLHVLLSTHFNIILP